jgi:hypothetical protein
MLTHGPVERCQNCAEGDLRPVIFLGYLPPVNALRPLDRPADVESWFPAELLQCRRCHLVQLGFVADPKVIFPPDYPYTSGSTRILRENFAELYRSVTARMPLGAGDLVLDIGSNDGTLLSNFQAGGHRVVGIEPTQTGVLARERGIPTLTAFFDRDSATIVRFQHGRPRVVTAANAFAHIPDVHEVVDVIASLLEPDGIFVSESHWLLALVETLQYDTIYHEHLRYYSLTSLVDLLGRHGLRVFDVQPIPTHGGSIRVYATRSPDPPASAAVGALLAAEAAAGLTGGDWIAPFRARITRSKLALLRLLGDLGAAGARIAGIGAPSRASTLVTHVGLDGGIVEAVYELAGSRKIGRYLPGTCIPVLDETGLYADPPDYALLLSWHLADELAGNLRRRGFRGDFIVPLPEPRVLDRSRS